jgi:hypothetical protein
MIPPVHFDSILDNLLPWIGQLSILAAPGAALPALSRMAPAKVRLWYGHALLAVVYCCRCYNPGAIL